MAPAIDRVRDITSEIRQNPNMAPDMRKQREAELAKLSAELNTVATKAAQSGADLETVTRIKAIQFDMNEALSVITDVGLRANIGNNNTLLRNTIIRGNFR
ncbi:MAG: hypothetical protein EAY75_07910 [Bacteroidetes bacterium]|nr:MAG: hypothetical protein EAY75_07910 [Bacteroidota bacterium]